MTSSLKNGILVVLVFAVAVLIPGCFFGDSINIYTQYDYIEEGMTLITISSNSDVSECLSVDDNSFVCTYHISDPYTGDTIIWHRSNISFAELFFELFILDPLVIQVPDSATAFAGSYLNNDTSDAGNLVITTGLSTVPADINRNLTAAPGTQFVIVELPPSAEVGGDHNSYSFNFNFQVPQGTTSIDVKPIFTARVELDNGSVYYPPILPCISNIASTPPITIPIPVPGDNLTLPTFDTSIGCTNETYAFGQGENQIPTLNQWGVIVLLLLFIMSAAYGIIRKRA